MKISIEETRNGWILTVHRVSYSETFIFRFSMALAMFRLLEEKLKLENVIETGARRKYEEAQVREITSA